MRHSHTSSNYFFRKSPSHYHMMLLVMSAFHNNEKLSVEELKTKLFKTSRPKSALIINEACEKGFLDYDQTILETTMAFKRAGADIIASYFAKDILKLIS